MKNSVRDRFPLTIETHEELRELLVKFRDDMKKDMLKIEEDTPENRDRYALGNLKRCVNGAGLFVDYLCEIKPKKNNSYFSYDPPNTPWPND